ncbi:family 20 glycosylhydrolase [Draconibacterium sp. IB214405]|uniref:family 20 glycosylhydrolase n=1 Tax=Draconibacterium sp. IB214405 TaxID=3097352 RepID=UPI002A147118|nr:family 20 glycosylhydrolase [Draconibacterium sp. IB214405]MDX8338512.1 family 20 glycosylhydrolase [Draconibacterium sp. IB214405]
MRKISLLSILVILVSMFQSCTEKVETDLTKTAFIPKPTSVTASGGAYNLANAKLIYVQEGAEGLLPTAEIVAEKITQLTGTEVEIKTTNSTPSKGIYIAISDNDQLNSQGYELKIKKYIASITGADAAGCFFGAQTFLQTLPVKKAESPIYVPTGVVTDSPEYAYRGAMLDVSRHFFNVEEVKQYIDFLAMYKMNVLHLHISDDQGWRIEIKSWPKLTEIGGQTEVGGGEGGFYTQEQYKELVQYAADRQIMIIPEIDMPGHTNAALASYAELNCDGKARELYTGTNVGFSTLCTDKEITYQFIDDVIRELAAITPGPYIHIGGDESHVTAHDDYVYFVNKVQDIVKKHGKKIIGWDEIANAKLIDDVTVQFWADVENTTLGVEKGAQVLMSPAARAYLDMQYDSTSHLGLHWAGYIEVDHGYNWDPATLVEGITKENILGIEAPLWSETVTNIDEVEYLVFPRLPGYAEIGWTAPSERSWDEYKTRLAKHGKRFEALGIDYYKSALVPWEE